MYLNKTIRYKQKGNTTNLISDGTVIGESGDYIIIKDRSGIQTSLNIHNIEVVDILLDNKTEQTHGESLING